MATNVLLGLDKRKWQLARARSMRSLPSTLVVLALAGGTLWVIDHFVKIWFWVQVAVIAIPAIILLGDILNIIVATFKLRSCRNRKH